MSDSTGGSSGFVTRPASAEDAEAIAEIYNQGIEHAIATFESSPRTASGVRRWFRRDLPILVVETEDGRIVGWAAASPYRPDRDAYARVAEFSVYVDRRWRGQGAGRIALAALVQDAERAGLWKLVSRIFPENRASLALCRALGFREVGVYRRHGKLRGEWRDCVIVERLLGEAASELRPAVRGAGRPPRGSSIRGK